MCGEHGGMGGMEGRKFNKYDSPRTRKTDSRPAALVCRYKLKSSARFRKVLQVVDGGLGSGLGLTMGMRAGWSLGLGLGLGLSSGRGQILCISQQIYFVHK